MFPGDKDSEFGGEALPNQDPGPQPKPEPDQDQTPQPDDESRKGSG